ncbi:MAG: hypothetical protein ABIL51_05765 [candidate division WOR-3 bacterium]
MGMKSYYPYLLMLLPTLAMGGELKFSGLVFGDYYHFTSAEDSTIENQNGFWIRRIYLTFDSDISEEFSARVRFEINTPYGFNKPDYLVPYIKDAYLKYKVGAQSLMFGIIPSPTFELMEEEWGKRYLEKTPNDLYRIGPSREFGIGAKGRYKIFKYYAVVGNGEGERSEYNRNKKGMLSLAVEGIKGLTFEVYGDWWDIPGEKDKRTGHVFLAYKNDNMGFGVSYTRQQTQGGYSNPEKWSNLRIAGIYFRAKFMEKFGLVLRYDRSFDKNRNVLNQSYIYFPSDTSFHFILASFEFSPVKNVFLSPNVEIVKSDDSNLKSTVISRFTVFYKF